MSTVTLGRTATRIAAELADWPRRRVDLSQLQTLLLAVEPVLQHSPERRTRLAEVIDNLAAAGAVQLPGERSYDRRARPALPRFVRVEGKAREPRRVSGAGVAWRPELAWAAELSFDEQTLSDLRAVNAFLRDGGTARPIVPLRERSLQLFGHEKRLEALMGRQLFFDGRLTLEQLRCEEVHPPFVYERIGDGPDVLAVENHHTFVSICRALPPDGPVGVVIYGAGAHFKASVTYLADLPAPLRRVLYFGDIDVDGLDIPIHANGVAASAGLPIIEPAASLYQLLHDHGTPAPVENPPSRHRVRAVTVWLPEELRDAATAVLDAGQRLAQEWVGTELLAREPLELGGT